MVKFAFGPVLALTTHASLYSSAMVIRVRAAFAIWPSISLPKNLRLSLVKTSGTVSHSDWLGHM